MSEAKVTFSYDTHKTYNNWYNAIYVHYRGEKQKIGGGNTAFKTKKAAIEDGQKRVERHTKDEYEKHKGRGKHRRDLNEYDIEAMRKKDNVIIAHADVYGSKQMRGKRSQIHSRNRSTAYRIKVVNETKGKRIK